MSSSSSLACPAGEMRGSTSPDAESLQMTRTCLAYVSVKVISPDGSFESSACELTDACYEEGIEAESKPTMHKKKEAGERHYLRLS